MTKKKTHEVFHDQILVLVMGSFLRKTTFQVSNLKFSTFVKLVFGGPHAVFYDKNIIFITNYHGEPSGNASGEK